MPRARRPPLADSLASLLDGAAIAGGRSIWSGRVRHHDRRLGRAHLTVPEPRTCRGGCQAPGRAQSAFGGRWKAVRPADRAGHNLMAHRFGLRRGRYLSGVAPDPVKHSVAVSPETWKIMNSPCTCAVSVAARHWTVGSHAGRNGLYGHMLPPSARMTLSARQRPGESSAPDCLRRAASRQAVPRRGVPGDRARPTSAAEPFGRCGAVPHASARPAS